MANRVHPIWVSRSFHPARKLLQYRMIRLQSRVYQKWMGCDCEPTLAFYHQCYVIPVNFRRHKQRVG